MLNDGALPVTEVLIQIAILEKPSTDYRTPPPKVIVGPFAIGVRRFKEPLSVFEDPNSDILRSRTCSRGTTA